MLISQFADKICAAQSNIPDMKLNLKQVLIADFDKVFVTRIHSNLRKNCPLFASKVMKIDNVKA